MLLLCYNHETIIFSHVYQNFFFKSYLLKPEWTQAMLLQTFFFNYYQFLESSGSIGPLQWKEI